MKAAVLHALGQSPRYEDFADPQATEGEVLVQVKAASLKNVDKMMASGSHYDRFPDLPCVCGVDGVGLLDDGARVYCGGARPPYGMMAERTVVSRGWCLPVPEQVDDVTAAALPNPALSAWLALSWRARLQPGEMVLILGATGVAGQLAVQIAKHLGAERVVAAGRNRRVLTTLRDLGADATIALDLSDQELTAAFIREAGPRRFDVVLDYLWVIRRKCCSRPSLVTM
jgi:NADPH:quinone reductase-like Zn-dependent oxidoreductase